MLFSYDKKYPIFLNEADDNDDENYDMGDNSTQTQQQTNNTENNNQQQQSSDDDENYDMGDDNSQNDDNSQQDDADNNGDDNQTDDQTQQQSDDSDDENYDMGDDSSSSTTQDDTSQDQSSTTDDSPSTPQNDEDDPRKKLRDLEASIFDQLSDDQKKIKIGELKQLYADTYEKAKNISTMVAEMDKQPEHAKIYDYILNGLSDLRKFIQDYLNNVFDAKTYIENLIEFQKYLTVFDTINNIFVDLKDNKADIKSSL